MNSQQTQAKSWSYLFSLKSYRTKMIVIFLVIALIPQVITNVFFNMYMKQVLTDEVHSKVKGIVEANVTAIDYAVDRNITMLKDIIAKNEVIKSGNEQEIKHSLIQFLQSNREVEDYVYVTKDDWAISSGSASDQKIDVSDREYIKQAKQTKKTVISDLMVSKGSGNNIIIIFEPILDDKQNYMGGLFISLNTDNLSSFTKTIQIGKSGFGYLMTSNGNLLTHPDEDKIAKNISDVFDPEEIAKFQETVLKDEQGMFEFTGQDHITREISYNLIPSTGWHLITSMVNDEVYGSLKTIETASLLIGLITTIVVAAIALYFSTKTTKPIINISDTVKKLATGDLTPRLAVNRKDELGQLADNMNQMLNSFTEIIGKVNLAAEQLSASSEELTAAAVESVSISKHISQSNQEVVTAGEGQLQGAKQTSIAMGEMASGVQRIAESSAFVTEAAQTSIHEVQQGRVAINQAVDQMKSINESVAKSAQDLQALESYSQKIGEIVTIITGITNQTGLLSLNASIEAARAGDQGRGFAVVANEVKKLAEQSSTSAADITKLIQEVQSYTSRAVQAMSKGVQDVENGSELINKAGQIFNQVTMTFQEISDQIQEVSAASEEMSAGTEEVTASMSEIVNMTQATHGYAQDISDGSQKQLISMEEISASAEELSHMALKLQESLAKFKTL
ncbi:methyl-accepting chemotaxis protein [Paenibacillus albiflavus]|uniref:Methyl-accepting chemotaxis protein n=1 Tax=Paenibacillus albiflavus TaxID=2545760 RepID=A0A4R4ENA7_9BACL|nr:methyl-accepting chemotaxis protein [Paenibacillus albiflavus]TCZ81083.1 methyl-accepting chemotaxis protein [Paenibacillus albiflavus]